MSKGVVRALSSERTMLLMLILFVGVALAIRFSMFYRSFKKELDYINDEIKRTIGDEQARWKRSKKRLFLSLIPFYNPRRKKKKSHQ